MHLPLDQDGLDECRAWAALTSASRQQEVLEHKLAYAHDLERLVEECATRLGVSAATHEIESLRLRVVLGGLIAAVCDDQMTFAQAKSILDLHLAALAASGLEHVASG